MNIMLLIILAVVLVSAAAASLFLVNSAKKRRQRPLKFREKWLQIQRLCASKETWTQAVIGADKLLESALKQKRFKGKSMGERMVAAQRQFSDNDAVWYAHNLAKKLIADSKITLREAEAKKSLVGVRQALRDLGILNDK